MYKVVIIDDEPIIVEGLCRSINWEAAGCEVVGTAFSGEEGITLIRNTEPDLIFSDIRMPKIDGLTMIAAIKSEFPKTQITILTGYRDFEYAQRAIQLGVSRYLLKPSKMEELSEALAFMTGKRAEEQYNKEQEEQMRIFLQEQQEIEDDGSLEPEESFRGSESALNRVSEAEPDTEILPEAEDFSQSESMANSAANSFIVKNAVTYIEEHYQEKLKLSDVADQVYVSQWHLSKLMNRYLGQNFSEILNGVRINKAKELLKDPALRIGDIADEVGFLDIAHFSRVFKKTVGISANEYRNQI